MRKAAKWTFKVVNIFEPAVTRVDEKQSKR